METKHNQRPQSEQETSLLPAVRLVQCHTNRIQPAFVSD